jgi:hypothetical protein
MLIGELMDNDPATNNVSGDAWVRGVGFGYTVKDFVAAVRNLRYSIGFGTK